MATYLTTEAADVLAATLQPPVTSYLAASAPAKLGALEEATRRIDAGYTYEGQRHMWDQLLEFPRAVPGGLVDRDQSTGLAIVPEAVKLACLRQADAILAGDAERTKAEARIGLTSQSTGERAEAYASPSAWAEAMLCVYARSLLQRFRIRTGRVL
jgi:hypothetical protein